MTLLLSLDAEARRGFCRFAAPITGGSGVGAGLELAPAWNEFRLSRRSWRPTLRARSQSFQGSHVEPSVLESQRFRFVPKERFLKDWVWTGSNLSIATQIAGAIDPAGTAGLLADLRHGCASRNGTCPGAWRSATFSLSGGCPGGGRGGIPGRSRSRAGAPAAGSVRPRRIRRSSPSPSHGPAQRSIGPSPEARELIETAPVQDRALWATAFYAGLRRGELRALRWIDVDLAGRVIRVERSWDVKEGVIDPKSTAGRRKVPIAAVLRDYLVDHRDARPLRPSISRIRGRSCRPPRRLSCGIT